MKLNDLQAGSEIEMLYGLIEKSRSLARRFDYPNIRDLHELLSLKEVREQTVVWLDKKNEVQAFCILDPYNNLLYECIDIDDYFSLFQAAVEFCDQIIKDQNSGKKNLPTLDVCCWGDDHLRIDCLKGTCFKRELIESIYFERSTRKVPQEIYLPPGFIIRPLAGEQEIDAYVDLHRKAFGTTQMTIEFRRSIMSSPGYDPQLDLVVQNSDGCLAAFCVCQINESENTLSEKKSGWTDPIGVHPDFRNLGLAKALIYEGLIRLRSCGMDHASLGTSSDNLAMINLAKTTGFLVTGRKLWFSREVS